MRCAFVILLAAVPVVHAETAVPTPGGSKHHFITNVGSEFAVLALDACDERLTAD